MNTSAEIKLINETCISKGANHVNLSVETSQYLKEFGKGESVGASTRTSAKREKKGKGTKQIIRLRPLALAVSKSLLIAHEFIFILAF